MGKDVTPRMCSTVGLEAFLGTFSVSWQAWANSVVPAQKRRVCVK